LAAMILCASRLSLAMAVSSEAMLRRRSRMIAGNVAWVLAAA
jgi:hypothetical protein